MQREREIRLDIHLFPTIKKSWDYNQSNKFFQERFASYLPTETLWDAAAFCRVTTGDTAVTGAVFVSTNYVRFVVVVITICLFHHFI